MHLIVENIILKSNGEAELVETKQNDEDDALPLFFDNNIIKILQIDRFTFGPDTRDVFNSTRVCTKT